MATINFTVTEASDDPNTPITSSTYRTSGAFTTGATAANVEDTVGDISTAPGEIFRATASADMWIRFGAAAAVGTGHFLGSGTTLEWEIAPDDAGIVSAIDA